MLKKIRVIVVDDSAFMRKMITDILESDPNIQVIATARNGEDALMKIKKFSPDVVTLDVEMPKMDGITALSHILKEYPLPVVMLSGLSQTATNQTLQAITIGAVDFITKPSGNISLDIKTIKDKIIKKVKAASNVDMRKLKIPDNKFEIIPPKTSYKKSLILIGASTGGPRAIQRILNDLPKGFSSPILIVQHLPGGFTKLFASRLKNTTGHHVQEAYHGQIIQDKTIYIAPGNFHMKIEESNSNYVISLSQEEPKNGHRPSVDVLFESASTIKGINLIAVILTGMGNDGAKGVALLKQHHPEAIIIAESEDSAIINGMPKAAIKTNTVNYVVHLRQLGELINRLTNNR